MILHILLVFAHLTCFCTSYLFLHILLVLHILFCTFLYSITHFTLFFSFFYLYICSCVVLLLYNLYSLHCPLSGPDLIYISLLIIPCIIYHVTNKETLTFTVINAFCVNLKHISKGNQLDLSQKVVTCDMSLEQTNGKIHIYIYIYIYILYVYVNNQIQQNKMQPEHVSEAKRFNIALWVCAPLSRSRPKQTLR